MQDQWYATWFDSPYYHLLYNNRNEEEASLFMDNLMNFLKPETSENILDLACGKGRHSAYLASKGYKVTGVDLSVNSITHAKQFENSHLKFFVHDMRIPMPEKFHLILSLFTSFGYFEDVQEDKKMLKSIYSSLESEGLFVLDFLNANYVMEHFQESMDTQRDDIIFHIKKRIENGFVKKQIEFIAEGKNHVYEECVRLFSPDELRELLLECGFETISSFGNYQLEPLRNDSNRCILVNRKR